MIERKAWLFSDTPGGAHASAVIYSLVKTAKANGLEPYAWLGRVLRDLPAAQTVEAVVALLPWNLRSQIWQNKHSINLLGFVERLRYFTHNQDFFVIELRDCRGFNVENYVARK